MDLAVGRTVISLLSASPSIIDVSRHPFPACYLSNYFALLSAPSLPTQ
jgi:hypothetical protein